MQTTAGKKVITRGSYYLKKLRLRQSISVTSLKETNHKIIMWLKRIGWLGFTFFFLKGLAWIAVWLGLAHFTGCEF